MGPLTLLAAALCVLCGGPAESPQEPGPESCWEEAQRLPPGSERNRALIRALERRLDRAAEALSAERVQLVWQGWLECAQELRFEEAVPLGLLLHAEIRAHWSAFSLALTLNRAGRYPDAEGVLAQQLGRTGGREARAELETQRGILALGAGLERRGRRHLGWGLVRGSSDAAVVLARLDLSGGRFSAARAGFRAVLLGEPLNPWARRGWALTLLPLHPGPEGLPERSYRAPVR